MVDIHHHLLFGLDDGAHDLETSVAMARIAAADGITHVVCTPHASGRYSFEPETVADRLAALQRALAAENIALTLGSGCDFHLSYENIEDALAHPRKYTINGGGYLLVELPDFALSRNLAQTFYDLEIAGMKPVLTHPERNPTLQQDPGRLREWVASGLIVQITADSVLGHMGRTAQKMAHRLLADRWVHVLATDAHGTERRAPKLSAARSLIAERYGAEYAQRLVDTNPRAIFDNQPWPRQPEARGLGDAEDDLHEGTARRGFLARLFGR
jgi:protein-tyrosine phosphatase